MLWMLCLPTLIAARTRSLERFCSASFGLSGNALLPACGLAYGWQRIVMVVEMAVRQQLPSKDDHACVVISSSKRVASLSKL